MQPPLRINVRTPNTRAPHRTCFGPHCCDPVVIVLERGVSETPASS